jgi:hypothetical protein
MRKLAFVAAVLALGASANADVLTNVYKIETGGSLAWFDTAADVTRGLALNPVTGNVIIADRGAVNTLHVIDPTGAEVLPAFNNTGITGGTFVINKAGVDGDGRVYAASLYGGGGSLLNVYRWVNEADAANAPVQVFTGGTFTNRIGDDLAITGAGANVKILASGNGTSTAIALLTDPENDGTFVVAEITGLPAFSGIPSIDFDANDSGKFWARSSAAASPAQQWNAVAGVAAAGGAADFTGQLPTNSVTIDHAVVGATTVIAVGPGAVAATTSGVVAEVFRLDETVARHTTGELAKAGSAVANGNAAGDVAISASGVLYVLYTNNSISAWSGVNSVSDWNLF